MKLVKTADPQQVILQNIHNSRPYRLWLLIWGVQSVLASSLQFIGQWFHVDAWQSLPLWTALAASVIVLWRHVLLRMHVPHTWRGFALVSRGQAAVAWMMIIGAVWTLGYVQAEAVFFIPLLKSFIVAVALVLIGSSLGRPIFYMGIWQFVLTVVVAIYYLGLASVVLGGAGGLCMIALGWMLCIGNTNLESEEPRK